MTTLAALRDDAFPTGTAQRGGAAGNGRVVTGTARYRARTPAFPMLRGGELALVPMALVPASDDPAAVERIIAQLSLAGVAGVVLFEARAGSRAVVAASHTADTHALPLFLAPQDCTPDGFDLAVTSALSRGRETLLARSQALQARFAAVALGGGGRQALVDELTRILGLCVAWEDPDARTVAWALPGDMLPDAFAGIATSLPDLLRHGRQSLQRWARGVRVAADRPPPVDGLPIRLDATDMDGNVGEPSPTTLALRYVVPVTVGPRHIGYLSALATPPVGIGLSDTTTSDLSGDLRLAVDPDVAVPLVAAAMAASVEEARTHAATEVQDDAIKRLVREWVDGGGDVQGHIDRRTKALGLEISGPFRVVALQAPSSGANGELGSMDHDAKVAGCARETVATLDAARGRRPGEPPSALWASIASGTVIVIATGDGADRHGEVAAAVRRAVADSPDVHAGLSRPAPTAGDVPGAARDAMHALHVSVRVPTLPRIAAFEELGVWRLLVTANQDELASFCDDLIGPLRSVDVRGGGLMQTLEAFLASGGGLQETATAVHAHRNTVLYRIDRIERLLGRSVRDPESRLTIGLAIRALALIDDDTSRATSITRLPKPTRIPLRSPRTSETVG